MVLNGQDDCEVTPQENEGRTVRPMWPLEPSHSGLSEVSHAFTHVPFEPPL